MKVKILGSISPYLKGKKNCPGYLVLKNNNKILLDCGNGITRLMSFPKDIINLNVIISHLHKDHYGDLLSLAYATYVYHNLGILKKRINVYLPKFCNKEEEIDYNYLINFNENYLNFIFYKEDSIINIDDIRITFAKNPHPVTTYSVKLESDEKVLVYSSDTGYENNSLLTFARGADLLICESTYLLSQKSGDNHLTAYEAAMIAKNSDVSKLLLTHFWSEINAKKYEKEAKTVFKNVKAAKEGKVIKLGGRKWKK